MVSWEHELSAGLSNDHAADGGHEVSGVIAADDEGAEPRWTPASITGLVVAVLCSLFVFFMLRPDLLFADTTPSGGDMGAHVWGPAYMRDHLLPSGQLTGWTPDWYAGFPAYHFYMVVPALAIIAVNAGLPVLIGIPTALIVLVVCGLAGYRFGGAYRYLLPAIGVFAGVLLVPLPYGIAFKLVSVSGLVGFPLAAWSMGRLARAPEPVPTLLPVASMFFLYDTNFTIYGGNVASTLAGEFAFSISLCLTLLALGLVARGMDDNRGRLLAAVVIGFIALTHVIPVFFAIAGFASLIALDRSTPRLWPVAIGIALALLPVALSESVSPGVKAMVVGAAVLVLAVALLVEPEVRTRFRWLLFTGPIAALLSAFWLLPFVLREPYFNDMGWERLNEISPAMLTVPMKVALPVAAVGLALSVAQRERIGLLFAMTGGVAAMAVNHLGESALWNARLLPFFYLSVYLVAAVGAALVIRFAAVAISEDFRRPNLPVMMSSALAVALGGLIAVAMPLRVLPLGTDQEDGTYEWLFFTSHAKSFVPSWTAWNYSGYEEKNSYREYHDVVTAMDTVGAENGCGRAMWEYSAGLDRYGTPMALMLLPHWTDGCISSMEGLYFESSASTPFHFLNQSILSQEPSRAQRDLPYLGYDINRGVAQLQTTGVRYYMALTDESIAAAREHPELTEVAEAQPFVIFEVAGSELVEALSFEPTVVTGRTEEQASGEESRFDLGWLGQAVTFYNDPAGYQSLPAEDGPSDWARSVSLLPVDGQPVEPVTVTDIESDTSSISFSVDEVGTPVLVKTSFFPNWNAEGADGPWRVGPNLMVVVPTANDVELTYGRTLVDWAGWLATLLGLAGLVGLAVLDRRGGLPFGVRRADDPALAPSDTDELPLEDKAVGARMEANEVGEVVEHTDTDPGGVAPDTEPDPGGADDGESSDGSLEVATANAEALAPAAATDFDPAEFDRPTERPWVAGASAAVSAAAPDVGLPPVDPMAPAGRRPPSLDRLDPLQDDKAEAAPATTAEHDVVDPDDADIEVRARLSTEVGPKSPNDQ